MRDIGGMTEGYTQPFALTDSVVDEALMGAQDFSLRVHVLARAHAFLIIRHVRAQEGTVVVVRDETNLLTLTFGSEFLVAVLTGNLAHLVFGVVA